MVTRHAPPRFWGYLVVAAAALQVKNNITPLAARIDVNSITARALAKALWTNNSLTGLDLSCNELDDSAGVYIARVLKRNSTLIRVNVSTNQLGTSTCEALGESLRTNSSVRYLNLGSNPLTKNGADFSGIDALAAMFQHNNTMTSLSLWRCALGKEAGIALCRGLELNRGITFLEVGYNNISITHEKELQLALERNLKSREERQALLQHDKRVADNLRTQEKHMQGQLRKERMLREWLKQQKYIRAEERRVSQEKR